MAGQIRSEQTEEGKGALSMARDTRFGGSPAEGTVSWVLTTTAKQKN